MSEIKVGDICKVSGWCWPYYPGYQFYNEDHLSEDITDTILVDDIKAKILAIDDYKVLIEIDDEYQSVFYCGIYAVHRKQCRKLVKLRKCDRCDGIGYWVPMGQASMIKCDRCNGRGKVKV